MTCPKGRHKVVVTCGQPTKPPHTDEKNPGICSRPRAFCVPDGGSAPDWSCWQHGGTTYEHDIRDLMFDSCRDAVEKLLQEAKDGKHTADSVVTIKRAKTKYTGHANKDGSYTVSTTMHWNMHEVIISGIKVSWPNMSAADKAAVQALEEALEAHEQLHAQIAEEYLEELNHGEPVSATAKDQDSAVAALNQKLREFEAEIGAELDRRQTEYDDKTEHGMKQSNIGGEDVILRCPAMM